MTIDTDKQILNQITSLIYQWLFGMTRDEMLVECKKHTPDGWRNLWEDEDENMRDQLSIAALNCLTAAEKTITDYINKYGWGWSESCCAEYYMLILEYKVEGLIIWNDEANGS